MVARFMFGHQIKNLRENCVIVVKRHVAAFVKPIAKKLIAFRIFVT